jgi:hypothetical protein
MRHAHLLAAVLAPLALAAATAALMQTASADAPLTQPETIQVKFQRLKVGSGILSREFQERLRQEGVATDDSPSRLYINVSAGITTGKASLGESYFLTLPAGAQVALQPSGSKEAVGWDLKVDSPEPGGALRAEIQLSYQGRRVRRAVSTPSGGMVAFRLDSGPSAEDLAVLTVTRLPRLAR